MNTIELNEVFFCGCHARTFGIFSAGPLIVQNIIVCNEYNGFERTKVNGTQTHECFYEASKGRSYIKCARVVISPWKSFNLSICLIRGAFFRVIQYFAEEGHFADSGHIWWVTLYIINTVGHNRYNIAWATKDNMAGYVLGNPGLQHCSTFPFCRGSHAHA